MKQPVNLKLLTLLLFLANASCSILGDTEDSVLRESLSDQTICAALDASTTDEFETNGFVGEFNQDDNDTSQFISMATNTEEDLDNENVMTLNSASIAYDFEDNTVDVLGLGGYLSRWKIIIVAFDEELSDDIDDAIDDDFDTQQDMIDELLNKEEAIEVQLAGPFDGNGCEWGDSDDLGTQSLTYLNYPLYDWDFFAGTDQVLLVIYEGDDGIHDDLILKATISRDDDETTLEDNSGNEFVITPNTDI